MTDEAFVFYTEVRLVTLTGVEARSLAELRQALDDLPGSAIFYHTHHKYLEHHFQKPVYYSDFTMWVSEALREEPLAEKLAALDLLQFTSIRQLREALAATIDGYTAELTRPPVRCRREEALHFCRSRSFVLPTTLVARTVPEFFEKLTLVSNASVYFHFFEARLRLGFPTNDFSRWLTTRGEPDLAREIEAINPYTRSLDELKQDIAALGAGNDRVLP